MCTDVSAVGLATDPADSDIVIEGAQLIGEPVVPFGSRTLRVATEAFIGDDRGRLWMIDMADTNPDNWCLRLYFDTLLSWHYPYEDCWPRDATNPSDPVSTCSYPPGTPCYHDDCCTGVATPAKCAADADAPRNMNAPRVMLIGAPTIAQDENDSSVILFGTGQYDGLSSWNRNRIFSLTDEILTDSNQKKYHNAKINWWLGGRSGLRFLQCAGCRLVAGY